MNIHFVCMCTTILVSSRLVCMCVGGSVVGDPVIPPYDGGERTRDDDDEKMAVSLQLLLLALRLLSVEESAVLITFTLPHTVVYF